MKRNLIQFIKFGLVGVSNTIVGYVLNLLCLLLLSRHAVCYDYIIANTVSFVLGVLWSFYWNERFVFIENKENYRNNRLVRLLKMYMSYAFTGIILNNVLSYVWISVLGISKLIAPLINSAVGVPVNYLINKKWTFEE